TEQAARCCPARKHRGTKVRAVGGSDRRPNRFRGGYCSGSRHHDRLETESRSTLTGAPEFTPDGRYRDLSELVGSGHDRTPGLGYARFSLISSNRMGRSANGTTGTYEEGAGRTAADGGTPDPEACAGGVKVGLWSIVERPLPTHLTSLVSSLA